MSINVTTSNAAELLTVARWGRVYAYTINAVSIRYIISSRVTYLSVVNAVSLCGGDTIANQLIKFNVVSFLI